MPDEKIVARSTKKLGSRIGVVLRGIVPGILYIKKILHFLFSLQGKGKWNYFMYEYAYLLQLRKNKETRNQRGGEKKLKRKKSLARLGCNYEEALISIIAVAR